MLPIFIALIVIAGILVIGSSGFLINKRRRRSSFDPKDYVFVNVYEIGPKELSAPEQNEPKGGSKKRKSKKSKRSKKSKKSKKTKKSN